MECLEFKMSPTITSLSLQEKSTPTEAGVLGTNRSDGKCYCGSDVPSQAAETCAPHACKAVWLQTQGGPDLVPSGHHSSSRLSSGTLLPKAGGNKGNPECVVQLESRAPPFCPRSFSGMGREALKQDNLRSPGVESTCTIQNRLNWPLTFWNNPPTPRPLYLCL